MKSYILQDGTTKHWTLKTEVDGKDKRIRLRPIHPGEPKKPHPDDVVALAVKTGHYEPGENSGDTFEARNQAPADVGLVPFVELFYRRYRRDRRPASAKRMSYILDNFLAFAEQRGVQHLKAVSVATINAFVDWRLERVDPRLKIQVKPLTVESELSLLSGLFKMGMIEKRIEENPISPVAKDLRDRNKRITKPKFLEPDQIQAFLIALDRGVHEGLIPQDYADLAKIMLYTGLRVTAAQNMEFGWVSADYTVHVPARWDKVKAGYESVLAPEARPVLERRRRDLGSGRVFPTLNSPSMSYYYIRRVVRKYGVAMPGAYNHGLRHSFATALVDRGVSIQTIGSLLGHHNVKTTQVYARVRSETKIKAVEGLRFTNPSEN